MKIATILKDALAKNASDIILTTGSKPILKIYGDVYPIDNHDILEEEEFSNQIFSTMSPRQKTQYKEDLELDYSIELKGYSRFRVNAFYTRNGPGLVLRPIKTEIPSYEELGLPQTLLELSTKKTGLILVTGGVGSGKSTTLSAIIDHITKTQKKHIVTVEDPIEFVFQNNNSVVEQREVGTSTKSFENGLKYALRQASDVIMIGEMRDIETFRLALRAAETGNLVLATLHTSGTSSTISRIIDMFPGEEKDYVKAQLAGSLLSIIWQDLVKTKDGKGRVLASELLINNTSIANMIRRDQVHQIYGAIETGGKDYGMYTMDKCLKILQEEGKIEG